MNPRKRREIFERLRAANPNPTTELHYRSPFELLVAVILSAQATDRSVNKATEPLFAVANTPAAIYAMGEEGLKRQNKTDIRTTTKTAYSAIWYAFIVLL